MLPLIHAKCIQTSRPMDVQIPALFLALTNSQNRVGQVARRQLSFELQVASKNGGALALLIT
jgi:hypothetical protein